MKVERMPAETAVNLGGLTGPALYADAGGAVVQANDAAVQLLGEQWREVASSLAQESSDRADRLDEVSNCILAHGEDTDEPRHFAVHVSHDEHGCQLLLIAEEVSENLVPSSKLAEILENMEDAFFAVDGAGRFVFANRKAAAFLGASADELLGKALDAYSPATRGFAEAKEKSLRQRRPITYDTRLADSERWIEVRAYPAGEGMAVYFADITERVRTQEQLVFLAMHDALTGLPNRSYFHDQLKKAVAKSRRDIPSTLLFLDMDRFKEVNDTVGHAAGDAVLIQFANVVAACAREEDTFARMGGDEFALLLEGTPLDEACMVALRIRDEVSNTEFVVGDTVFSLGVSIGLSPVHGTGAGGHVMALADSAMYEAKRKGGEQVCMMTPQSID